jgi:NHLM bacteriocin system ABC transporter ATP-binding protein
MTEHRLSDPLSSAANETLTGDDELFLLHLRYKLGRLLQAGGHQPIALDDPQTAWVVYTGWLNVFALSLEGGKVAGIRHHVLQAQAGQMVLSIGSDVPVADRQIALIAVGGPDTGVIKIQLSELKRLAGNSEFSARAIAMLDRWVQVLAGVLASDLPPKESVPIQLGAVTLEADHPVRARRGVVWVEPDAGTVSLLGLPALALPQPGFSPLAGPLWLGATDTAHLQVMDTATYLARDPNWASLEHFHTLVRAAVAQRVAEAEQSGVQQMQERGQLNRTRMAQALTHLSGVMQPTGVPFLPGALEGEDALLSACSVVGQALGLTIQAPARHVGTPESADRLGDIARASRLRIRRVTLQGAWWRTDNGPLLGYQSDDTPVALLPRPAGLFSSRVKYDLIAPHSRPRIPVTPEVAAGLSPVGYVFYRPLPARALTALDLFRLGFRGTWAELLTVALTGGLIGLLGLVIPLMIGVLFNTIIPSGARGQLWQLGSILLACVLSTALFLLAQNVTVLRLEGKWDGAVLPAVWDRLLRLPPSFFRHNSSGDLAERAMGLDIIRRTLSNVAISSILAGPTALFSLGLLFYYSVGLAWVAVGLALLLGGVTFAAWQLSVRYERALAGTQGHIAGVLLEFTTGIAKLRVAGAESRAFARWANAFGSQRALAFQARNTANGLAVFNAVYPAATTLAIFGMVAWSTTRGTILSTGDFLAFNAAFGQFLWTSLAISATLLRTFPVLPLYERVRPILQALPEVTPLQSDPGELRGEIEVSHVLFRYRDEEPAVLKDLSFQVQPGEFVALVGPSGCGKSTLLRLLLGFERPLAGAIYYDGQDLWGVDVERVRRQVGVVLQHDQLIAGNILSNIIGSLPLKIDDAWEAARLVGLDNEISEMPMGMHTLVGEGRSTLSGGQRQRVLIARAIVSKPRILLFDEATSALDNRSQAQVSASLEQLQATRIVVAHRLSTIVNADRIFVIDGGRVVQSGTYAELSKQRGLFEELTRRQRV